MKFYWLRYLSPEGGGGGGTENEKDALLKQISKQMSDELEKRGYQTEKSVGSLIEKALEGLPLEALRSFDQSKIDEKIRNIAAEVDKVKTQSGPEQRNGLKEALDKAMADIEVIMRSGGHDRREIKITTRAAAVMTTDNTITETGLPEDILNSFSLDAFVPKRYGTQYIYEIADRTVNQEIEEYKTWLEEGNNEGAFAIVAEGGLKPLVSANLVRNFAKAKKVAGKYVITEEFAKWRKEAYNRIRTIIRDKLVRDYSAILTTDLNAQAAGYTGSALDGTVVAPNDYDAIGAVASQIQSINFNPDVLIIHPQDAWRIRLTKDSEGRYLFPVVTENGQTVMLGIRVVTSTYQTVGTFTLGESGLFKIEEEPITIRIGYGITTTAAGGNITSVEHDFDHNRLRVILELFFRDFIATNHIGSYVRASFATVKAALAAA